jgi:O-antigen/teichoic acid export membrane protein
MLTRISNKSHDIFEKIFGTQFSKEGFIAYANNVQWFTLARFISLALSFLTTILIARLFGPEQFGILNYVISIIGLFSILSNFGISATLYKELTLKKEKREEIFGSALTLNYITATTTFIIVLISLFFIRESFYVKSLIVLLSLTFLTQPMNLLSFDFLKDREGKYVAITQIITLIVSSFLKILITYLYSSVTFFILILVAENLISGAIYIYQIKKIKFRNLSFKIQNEQIKYIFYSSLPLILYSAFSEIYSRIDQIMLRSYVDITTVGIYSASVKVTEMWYLVPNILLGALFPALANVKNDRNEYNKRYNILLIALVISSILISCFIFLFKEGIINLIYGNEFSSAANILGVYIFSIVGFFVSSLIYQDLFLNKNKWAITIIPFLTALINILLNLILIPAKGAVGAALATTVSYNLVPLCIYLYKKIIK